MFTSIPTPGKRTEGREGREDSNTVCMDLANIREKNNTEYSTRDIYDRRKSGGQYWYWY
jgi:hypothetical protein